MWYLVRASTVFLIFIFSFPCWAQQEESSGCFTVFLDRDGDGFGANETAALSCHPGLVSAFSSFYGGDADDENPDIFPEENFSQKKSTEVFLSSASVASEYEVCDGIDNDDNGVVDDNAVDAQLWFMDADGDGYVEKENQQLSCFPSPGYFDFREALGFDCKGPVRECFTGKF